METFKIGDIVKVNNHSSSFNNRIGICLGKSKLNKYVIVGFDIVPRSDITDTFYFKNTLTVNESDLTLIHRDTQSNKFHVGEKVVITSGKYEHCKAIVSSIKDNGEYELVVMKYPVISYGSLLQITEREENICSINDIKPGDIVTDVYVDEYSDDFNGDILNQVPVNSIDITKYIPDNTMTEIATKVFEETIRGRVEDIIKARSGHDNSFGGIVDIIIGNIAESFVDKFSKEYNDEIIDKIRGVLNKHINLREKEDAAEDFETHMRWQFEHIGEEYVNSHKEELQQEMVDHIRDVAKNLSKDSLIRIIGASIDINEVLRTAFSDVPGTPNFPA